MLTVLPPEFTKRKSLLPHLRGTIIPLPTNARLLVENYLDCPFAPALNSPFALLLMPCHTNPRLSEMKRCKVTTLSHRFC